MSEVGILDKLEQISIRYEEIAKQMVDPEVINDMKRYVNCLLYTSPSPRDSTLSRMPSSA